MVHTISFVSGGEVRRVDLRTPCAIRRGRRRVVQLLDLWVATMLPGELLDLTFTLVTCRDDRGRHLSARVDALTFAKGFITPATRELWWDDPADRRLQGQGVESVVVTQHDLGVLPSRQARQAQQAQPDGYGAGTVPHAAFAHASY
jgi:hypothetical protein